MSAKLELNSGNKWLVEYQKGQQDLTINSTAIQQSVVVYKCENSTLVVRGKVNGITIDSCSNFNIIFESSISPLDVINCKRVQVQVEKTTPAVIINKTANIKVFLSKESLHTEFVSSLSNEMNVYIPTQDGEDTIELPIPETLTTRVVKGKLETEVGSKAVGV
ncbi:predicted protein [Naegleria gruberi]|uniref:Predicted protein n=1 Tax=Naegleria gruberi TaxID=5762 RepID=D2W6G5_NAEGR|nr:uncharacterized protein NAEGRDRAFT_82381 [Naegleria gruberi]EFC35336.1 predicted protein [Naegleria gruberi]|eukprot:XP_002668080.1 predicted protein [Naegleria gruberi strain NEG-M]